MKRHVSISTMMGVAALLGASVGPRRETFAIRSRRDPDPEPPPPTPEPPRPVRREMGVRERARLRRRKCRTEYDAHHRSTGDREWLALGGHTRPGNLRMWIEGVKLSPNTENDR